MKKVFCVLGVFSILTAAGMTGCAKRQVTRLDPSSTTDLSGNWNDTDSRLVSEQMIQDLFGSPWLEKYNQKHKKPPVLIVGSIQNKSLEHIPVAAFVKDLERSVINSGDAQIVATAGERQEIRQERAEQQANASPETLKKMGRELGADFMLIGEINQINDQESGKQVRYYQVDLQLVDIETNRKTWAGQKKIKKGITKGKYKL